MASNWEGSQTLNKGSRLTTSKLWRVHPGAYTVAEYHNYDACGVIAVWTR